MKITFYIYRIVMRMFLENKIENNVNDKSLLSL